MKMKYYVLSVIFAMIIGNLFEGCHIVDNTKDSLNQINSSFALEEYQWEMDTYPTNKNVGSVLNKDAAITTAKELWYEEYSETISDSEIEVCFDEKNECWHVFNVVEADMLGGVFHALIEKNGKVLAVWAED